MALAGVMMLTSRCMRFFRRVLIAGLCYSLVLQVLLAQSADISAAASDTKFVICHGNGDQTPPADDDGSLQTGCHFCWLPISGPALLPDAGLSVGIRIATAASGYFAPPERIVVVRPPPRGASQAPPPFA
jgi:hypothetical protein